MEKKWVKGKDGEKLKYENEKLLNYGINNWGLNKACNVGPTSKLIRECSPKSLEEWEKFYFTNAVQKKRNGIKVTRECIIDLGKKLYRNLSEEVPKKLASIKEEQCIDYTYNLILNRTYEGYQREINIVYGQLESILGAKIEFASDELDRTFNVDFLIQVKDKYIGLQIKSVSGLALDHYLWENMHEQNHAKFEKKFGGRVFFIYSRKSGKKARIDNSEVIEQIRNEIDRLNKL